MGRIDLPDRWRDEDGERAELVESWKRSLAEGTAMERCDRVIALECREIPARLTLAMSGVKTHAPDAKRKNRDSA